MAELQQTEQTLEENNCHINIDDNKSALSHLLNDNGYLSELCHQCIKAEINEMPCRWIMWRIMLGVIPLGNEEQIRNEVKRSREYYASEHDKYINIRAKTKLDLDVDNPLSQSTNVNTYSISFLKEI